MTVKTVTRSPIGTNHVFAECRDCDKSWDDYNTAADHARQHAAATGHTVNVERAQTWVYNPKDAR